MDSVAPFLEAMGAYAKDVPGGLWYVLGSVVLVAGLAALVAATATALLAFVGLLAVRNRLRARSTRDLARLSKYTELEVVASGAPFDTRSDDSDYDSAVELGLVSRRDE